MKESTLQKNIIQMLRANGCYVFKPVGSMGQQRGTPDLLICSRGMFIAAELKVFGEKPTRLQEMELEKVRKAGGWATAVHSVKEMEALINAANVN